MEEWSFEVEWSQILCSLVGFTKTNTERHFTTLTSIQAWIIFFLKIFLVFLILAQNKDCGYTSNEYPQSMF